MGRDGSTTLRTSPTPGVDDLDDAALVALMVLRDERAIEELVHRFEGPLFSLAYRILRGERDAADVVQEVFLAAWHEAARYDPRRGSVATWLLTMTRYRSIDVLRREGRRGTSVIEIDLTERPAEDDVHEQTWLRARGARVRSALAELSDVQREAVSLAFFAGMTHVEVAEALSIPLGTAKTRIRDGLRTLRHLLGDSLDDAPSSWTSRESTR